jgi:rfaE bifunctional protein kinase chain/domain
MVQQAEIDQLFSDFTKLKVMIIGDVMVDSYYWGKVDRISPEAPVPIVAVTKKESRMGGAANVALNVQALGATPLLCSVIGSDDEGQEFLSLVVQNQQNTSGIQSSSERRTTKKTRIIGNNAQMLRVDAEDLHPLSKQEESAFLERIESLLKSEAVDAIIFEDYDKGVITPTLIKSVVKMAQQKGIPTTVDPKKQNFLNYQEVDLFKPNLKELKEGLKLELDKHDMEGLKTAIQQLEAALNNQSTLITLSENGVYAHSADEAHHIAAHRRDITDVSGAGDTVISVATLCLALNKPLRFIAELANLAGGLVCENVGVVPINKAELQKEAEKLLATQA